MANITTRSTTSATDPGSTSAKGSALSHTQLDSNFLLLNNGKLENTGTPDLTGSLQVKGSGGSAVGAVRFFDNDDSNYVELKSPATVGSNETFILPAADGTAGQFLKTDGSGNLTFATVSGGGSGDITSVVAGAGLTGGATTGDATLNVVGGTGITANTNDIAIDSTVATLTGTQTLTNKTITAPTITATSTTVGGKIKFLEGTDNGTNGVTLVGAATTADVDLFLPAAADTLVGKATTDTLTNKTLTTPVLAGGTITADTRVDDDIKLKFGSDSDAYVRWRNSKTLLDANVAGNIELRATDSGASGKGNIFVRADNKIELRAGTDLDSAGDLILTAFDDFQFKKTGFASTDSDVGATTNNSTSVTLSRSLTTGEARALADEALFFYDNSSFSGSNLRTMSNYILITGTSGSGSSTVITLEEASSTLGSGSNTGRHLQVKANDPVVVVDGTRGRLDSTSFILQNRIGNSGAQGRRLIMESVEFHDGAEFLGTGHDQDDEGEERPVSYEFGTTADKNTFDLTHYTQTNGSYSSATTLFTTKKRTTEASTVASKTTPDVFTFGVNPQLPSYAVAALPSGALAGEIAFCTNETDGAVMVFSDGTNWRRCTDRAVAS